MYYHYISDFEANILYFYTYEDKGFEVIVYMYSKLLTIVSQLV